jgi:Trk K+ transport system NAD-binding subunit
VKRRNVGAIYWAYTWFLIKEFRWPLGLFFGILVVGGLAIHLFHEEHFRLGEACYMVFTMMFLEPGDKFPSQWYLQIIYYAAPVLGVFVIADSLVRFGLLLFEKKTRLKEWWVMVASTKKDHIIVAGVGKVGYRVIRLLKQQDELVVGIEKNPDKYLTTELQDMGVPIITGEARLKSVLNEANVARAAAIICATNDDLANMDIGLTAKELNPGIRVVLRIFDDTLAQKFADVFKMPAISTSQAAAPVFVAAATGRNVHYSFHVDRTQVQISDLKVTPRSKIAGKTVGEIESAHQVRILCHGADAPPKSDASIRSDDTIVVAAAMDKIRQLEELNR